MDKILNVLMSRKSVRAYEDKKVEKEKVDAILRASMRAATAGNMMLYSIVNIESEEIKKKLAMTCDNQPFIATAPLVLLFVADYHRWYKYFEMVAEDGLQPPRKLGKGDMLLACSDALIAAQTAVTAADALGLGSCYIGDIIEQFETHQALLNLPAHTVPVALVCFGYPTEEQQKREQPPRFDEKYIVSTDTYQELSKEELLAFAPKMRAEALLKNKFNSAFSIEMNRSAELIYENFIKS